MRSWPETRDKRRVRFVASEAVFGNCGTGNRQHWKKTTGKSLLAKQISSSLGSYMRNVYTPKA